MSKVIQMPNEIPKIPEGIRVEKTWLKWFSNNTLTSNNILISLLTTLIFIIALLLFFWYIISDQLKIILLDKVNIIKIYTKYDSNAKETIIDELKKINLDEKKFEENIKERNDNNIKLFIEHMLWWFVLIFILIILTIFYMIIYKVTFSKADLMLVFFVLTAFVAEIIFYLVVIREWVFIGDHEIVNTFLKF